MALGADDRPVPHSIVAVSRLDDYHRGLTIRLTPTKMLSRESFSEGVRSGICTT